MVMKMDALRSMQEDCSIFVSKSRLLASRDSSLASSGGDHPPVGVDFVKKSGSDVIGTWQKVAGTDWTVTAW